MDETWDLSQGISTLRWWYGPNDVDQAHQGVKATQEQRTRDPLTGALVVRPAGLVVADALRAPGPVSLRALVQFAGGTVSEIVYVADAPGSAAQGPRAFSAALCGAALHLLSRIGAPNPERAVAAGKGQWTLAGCEVVLELGPADLRLTLRRPVASRP